MFNADRGSSFGLGLLGQIQELKGMKAAALLTRLSLRVFLPEAHQDPPLAEKLSADAR
jgi:hypothetical protein